MWPTQKRCESADSERLYGSPAGGSGEEAAQRGQHPGCKSDAESGALRVKSTLGKRDEDAKASKRLGSAEGRQK